MVILAAILVIHSGFIFLTFRHMAYQELDGALSAKALKVKNAVAAYLDVLGYDKKSFEFSVSRVVAQTGEHPHKNKIEKLEKLWLGQMTPFGIHSDYVEFLNPTGKMIAHSNNLHHHIPFVSPKDIRRACEGHLIFKDIVVGKEYLRLLIAPAIYQKLQKDQNYVMVIATSRERLRHILRQRLISEMISVIVILLIASLLSQLFAKQVLSPINAIAETARNINYKDLSVRIKSEHGDVEIKGLVDALNEMMSRLEKSFRYIAEFSAHVSHELKTPLAILRGESELALRSKHSEGEYRRVIQDNLEEIARMTKIVEDLLLLTKLDYQPQIFKFEEFDLVEFFKAIEESSRILAGEKEITVTLDAPQKQILIRGDKTHLRRLFFNLINNSIKFTYAGGKIHLRVQPEGRSVQISFTDTGIGIPEENLPKIFDKFFHYNGTGIDVPAGNGLGLSIAQSIAKIHSGEISVKSRVGKGTTFTVKLPIL
jgi:heavy metal sensor kinase